LEALVTAEEQRDRLTSVLEGIASYAPGRAGVIARDALVEMGVWADTVESHEQPTPLEWWLTQMAPMPGHEMPSRDGLRFALVSGRVELAIASVPESSPPAALAARDDVSTQHGRR
jgi:hypothetical protein